MEMAASGVARGLCKAEARLADLVPAARQRRTDAELQSAGERRVKGEGAERPEAVLAAGSSRGISSTLPAMRSAEDACTGVSSASRDLTAAPGVRVGSS
jgi:hypothetical protein